MQKSTLNHEWNLLEIISKGLSSPQENETFENLIKSNSLQWDFLLEQAILHKILPLLAFYTTGISYKQFIPYLIRLHLRSALDVNRYKTSIYRRETVRILKAINKQKLRYVCTKGITLESTLYEGNGMRYFSDIDFMIAAKDRKILLNTISTLGYQTGKFDWHTRSVLPLSHQQMTIFKLNQDHLPHSFLITNDPVVHFVKVDFATSLTWTRSSYNVPIEDALAEIVYQPIPGIPDVQMPCFNSKFPGLTQRHHI